MSIRRLLGTGLAMAAVAVALRALTPDLGWVSGYGLDLQRAADDRGAEALLLGAVAAAAWTVWAWGVLGLALTALSAVPGAVGALSRTLARRLLPAGARRAAALALGVGLVAGGPLLTACGPGPAAAAPAAVAGPAPTDVRPDPAGVVADGPGRIADGPRHIADWPGRIADWPTATDRAPAGTPTAPTEPTEPAEPATSTESATPARPAPVATGSPQPEAVPDWPMPASGTHVVLRGECLWDIASADLRRRTGRPPSGGEVAAAVHAWWRANAAVIGPDPDVLLPGQVLNPPAAP
ncbi:LysM peptidoglycan-binding domain-containing protein [Geodermatophilus sp. SYSU D01186]